MALLRSLADFLSTDVEVVIPLPRQSSGWAFETSHAFNLRNRIVSFADGRAWSNVFLGGWPTLPPSICLTDPEGASLRVERRAVGRVDLVVSAPRTAFKKTSVRRSMLFLAVDECVSVPSPFGDPIRLRRYRHRDFSARFAELHRA